MRLDNRNPNNDQQNVLELPIRELNAKKQEKHKMNNDAQTALDALETLANNRATLAHYRKLTLKESIAFRKKGWHKVADKLADCANTLIFTTYTRQDGTTYEKLTEANFCGEKLCAMCNWRWQLKYLYKDLKKSVTETDTPANETTKQ